MQKIRKIIYIALLIFSYYSGTQINDYKHQRAKLAELTLFYNEGYLDSLPNNFITYNLWGLQEGMDRTFFAFRWIANILNRRHGSLDASDEDYYNLISSDFFKKANTDGVGVSFNTESDLTRFMIKHRLLR